MSILMPKDTRDLLKAVAENCRSRSLFMDRFADPFAKDSAGSAPRRDWFDRLVRMSAEKIDRVPLGKQLPRAISFHGQLQSRLMVNMAGGVMENAGLLLDRFGLPYIPGSAVKGCARRAAIAALHEWCETGQKPGATDADRDNLFKSACERFAFPADMLLAIARVFGWCEQDWKTDKDKDGRFKSDFAWACGSAPATVWKAAVEALATNSGWRIDPKHEETPWKSLPNFAGSVAFLPAHPVDLPAGTEINGTKTPKLGTLELDVVTCHHPDYYSQKTDNAGNLLKPVATDDDDPNPVVFPTVAPGHVFTFALAPLRGADDSQVQHARIWLATGLQTFGLGAKTAAGYGWFDASDTVHSTVTALLNQKAEREKKAVKEKAAREKAEAEAKTKAAEKAARDAALAGLSADERADKEVELMSPSQFENKVRAFHKEPKRGGPTDDEKKAIVRALRGPRLAFWQEFKAKASKGDLANAANGIRQLSKQMFPGSEGKMP